MVAAGMRVLLFLPVRHALWMASGLLTPPPLCFRRVLVVVAPFTPRPPPPRTHARTQFSVDLEHHRLHSFLGYVCLVQVSTPDHDVLIDCLQPDVRAAMRVLQPAFAHPRIVKVGFVSCVFVALHPSASPLPSLPPPSRTDTAWCCSFSGGGSGGG